MVINMKIKQKQKQILKEINESFNYPFCAINSSESELKRIVSALEEIEIDLYRKIKVLKAVLNRNKGNLK